MIRIAIIFENFGPYHLARLREASGACDLLGIEVLGKSSIYTWDNRPDEGQFRRVTLAPEAHSVTQGELGRRLENALSKFRPSVVIVPGWATPYAWSAMRWGVRKGVPMVCLSESTVWDEPRSAWKLSLKRKLVSLFSSALVGGTRHRDYLGTLGFSASRIFLGYDAVDNLYFREEAKKVRGEAEAIRMRLDLPLEYFLTSARFVAKKNLSRLLQAYARYREECVTTPWSLVLLGDGELRSELERQVDALELGSHVRLPGFRQYQELPAYYALAGAFIHPSEIEPWGLVVNEAMASGLPVLVSNRCGCVPELVCEGVNGFTFRPADVAEMAFKMAQVASPNFPRRSFGLKGEEIVAEWGPDRFTQGLMAAANEALAHGPAQANITTRALLWILNRA